MVANNKPLSPSHGDWGGRQQGAGRSGSPKRKSGAEFEPVCPYIYMY